MTIAVTYNTLMVHAVSLFYCRLWFWGSQEVLRKSAKRLPAGHQVCEESVWCRSDDCGEGEEHTDPCGGGEMYQRDRTPRSVIVYGFIEYW